MTLDIEGFHRTAPAHPEHKRWLVVRAPDDSFFVDHCMPFGAASASSNAGMVGNAIADLWEAKGFGPVSKYEDDFTVFRAPTSGDDVHTWTYSYDEAATLAAVASMKVPWKASKQTDYAAEFASIGFWWDCPRRRVSLTDAKRSKFLARVRSFIASFRNDRCSLHDVQVIHGTLCHITFVYPEGRSHLPALSNFAATFKGHEWKRHRPGAKVFAALGWWEAELTKPDFFRQLHRRREAEDIGIFVDASTDWGVGILIRGRWDAWTLRPGWSAPGRHNTWLETLAIELTVYAIERQGFADARLILYSDSQAAIGAFQKGRSPSLEMNLSIRRTNSILDALNVALDFVYVKSEENPADAVSRGVLGKPCDRLVGGALPAELVPYLARV
jgi:hypothetical protein